MGASRSKPVVGITANIFPAEDRKFYKNKELLLAESSMCRAVWMTGGVPIMLPPAGDSADVARLSELIDGLLLSGGADVAPQTYGASLQDPAWAGQPDRDIFEIALYQGARHQQMPVLGVCRGAQIMNVAEGGTLFQDLVTLREGSEVHRSQEQYDALAHPVEIEPGSILHKIIGAESALVNTVHHQGIDQLGEGLRVLALAPDGVIEAIAMESDRFTLGIQWHPEWMLDDPIQVGIFEAFIEATAGGKP